MVQAVRFDAKSHIYTNEAGIRYLSATQLIGHFKQPFNGKYWSLYKAAQRVIQAGPRADSWSHTSRFLQRLDKTEARLRQFILATYPEALDLIFATQTLILDEWEQGKNEACDKGTKFHNEREAEAYEEGYSVLGDNELSGKTQPKERYNFNLARLPDGYWPELLVFDHQEQTAGQVDRTWITSEEVPPEHVDKMVHDGYQLWKIRGKLYIRYLDIDDWKTNKEIKKTNKHGNMLGPVSHLPDCNYWHYAVQISIYARTLERQGYTVRTTRFTHCLDDGTRIAYHTPYLRDEVTQLITHYRAKYGYNHSPLSAPKSH